MNFENNNIRLRDAKGSISLETDFIIRIEALNNYSRLFLSSGKQIIVSKVLKHFEHLLNDRGFARIHRSHLVNKEWIQNYNEHEGEVMLKNNELMNVSRRKKQRIKKSFAASLNL
jgi:two-component system, LytTR family, response regulator